MKVDTLMQNVPAGRKRWSPRACLRRGSARRGATATELAISLPLLITLVLACIDFGRCGYAYISVSNAARVGAGVGSNHKVTTATAAAWRDRIRTAVEEEFAGQAGMNASNLTIPDPQMIVESTGLRRVRVRADYRFEMLVPWPLLPSPVTLSRTVEMRAIR